jgi:polar amino acid transport system substrate-binding protein
MVRVDDDRWATADEFFASNSRLGTQIGTTNYELATTLTDEGLIDAYESFPVAVLALLSGDVDAVIIDDVAGAGYVGEGNEGTKLLDGNLQSDPLGFIYAHGSALIAPVDAAIEAMEADGTLAALIDKWFINPDA